MQFNRAIVVASGHNSPVAKFLPMVLFQILSIVLLLVAPIQLASADSTIIELEKQIRVLEARQVKILAHLGKIDEITSRYAAFSETFHQRLKSIITDGAQCRISEQKYLEAIRKHGKKSSKSKMFAELVKGCHQMRKSRLSSIKELSRRSGLMKEKIAELESQREISMQEADNLKYYIDQIKQDYDFASSYGD